jgi:hypothetical protein
LEARGGIEPPIKVLQTFALPLGDRAKHGSIVNDSIPVQVRLTIIFSNFKRLHMGLRRRTLSARMAC